MPKTQQRENRTARRSAMGEYSKVKKTATTPMQPPLVNVAVRRQTPTEQRQFNAAFELFLAELVRQHFGREGKCNDLSRP
jgi:hypothetical protein